MPYKDLEKRRAYGRDWMKRNPEKAREGMRRWRRNHPDEHSADSRLYYARNADKVRVRQRAYQRANRAAYNLFNNAYRARRKGAAGSFNMSEWLDLCARYEQRCAYCGRLGRLVVEHRIPLSRGGSNHVSNIAPACASCNNRKHTLTEDEFRARLAVEAAAAKLVIPPDAAG
jgi:5-methylcytosine-specific restriction endonuclease McrA